MSKIKSYKGENVTVTFESDRCIHTGRCLHGCPESFNLEARPWIQADNASEEKLLAAIDSCPSGALQYDHSDSSLNEKPDDTNTIRIRPNGPLFLRGNFHFEGSEKIETRLSLCRCGLSKNKPFCDNAHKEGGFKDAGNAKVNPERMSEEVAEGEIEIGLAEDGPLLIRGQVEIVNAKREVVYRFEKAALCRCGASENKPFCDGKHREIGFNSGA